MQRSSEVTHEKAHSGAGVKHARLTKEETDAEEEEEEKTAKEGENRRAEKEPQPPQEAAASSQSVLKLFRVVVGARVPALPPGVDEEGLPAHG